MPSPEQPEHIPGADRDGMGNGMGIVERRIDLIAYREIAGIEVVGFQPVGDITDGVEVAGIEVKAQFAENRNCEFRTGIGLADTDLDVQGRQQRGQMVVDIPVCLQTHGRKDLLKLVPLAGGEGESVDLRFGSYALVLITAGMLLDEAAVERGMVEAPGEGIQIGHVFFGADRNMVIRILGDEPDKPPHTVRGRGKQNIQIFLLTLHRTPPQHSILE